MGEGVNQKVTQGGADQKCQKVIGEVDCFLTTNIDVEVERN